MRQHANLKLKSQQNVPFYAFSFEGKFEGHDAVLTVLRTNDGASRILGTVVDEEAQRRTSCSGQQWVFSALVREGDCEFLTRLPKGLRLTVSWDTDHCSAAEVEGTNVQFVFERSVLEQLGLLTEQSGSGE